MIVARKQQRQMSTIYNALKLEKECCIEWRLL